MEDDRTAESWAGLHMSVLDVSHVFEFAIFFPNVVR